MWGLSFGSLGSGMFVVLARIPVVHFTAHTFAKDPKAAPQNPHNMGVRICAVSIIFFGEVPLLRDLFVEGMRFPLRGLLLQGPRLLGFFLVVLPIGTVSL